MTTVPKIVTFGCRLNTYESEVIRKNAEQAGLTNAIIFNTCAVTAEAERQARQAIRKARRDHPDADIIVTGCSAQIKPDFYAAMPEVSRVLGNIEKMDARSFLPISPDHPVVSVGDIMTVRETAAHLISGFENQVRAFIEIQNGCDHRCTFCTIPFGRGNNRSIPMGAIVTQVRGLIQGGCREIVLTGVDITGYGADLPGTPTLGQLVRRLLNAVPDLPRLRLSSLDPVEIDADLLDIMVREPRLMPHFHLSVQSGDDMILKRMKRRHLRHHVVELCGHIQKNRPEAVFGADIIAGFPTETDEMFGGSVSLMRDFGFAYLHVFPYSPRAGTPAARMPQVLKPVIKDRARILRTLGDSLKKSFFQGMIGGIYPILMERGLKGHTPQFAPVRLAACNDSPDMLCGTIRDVRITDADHTGAVGVLI